MEVAMAQLDVLRVKKADLESEMDAARKRKKYSVSAALQRQVWDVSNQMDAIYEQNPGLSIHMMEIALYGK